jgi:hypothetical protein
VFYQSKLSQVAQFGTLLAHSKCFYKGKRNEGEQFRDGAGIDSIPAMNQIVLKKIRVVFQFHL